MPTDFDTILKLTVPLIVEIGRQQMPLSEVLELAPGSILELPKTAEEDLELSVNNKQVGTGAAVKVGENFGIRIHQIQSARDRAQAVLS